MAKPEQFDWEMVEHMLTTLQDCLDHRGDMKQCMHDLLPSFREPGEVNGAKGILPQKQGKSIAG